MRIELGAPPPAPEWPDGLRVAPFDPERDALEFHAAHQETFADHWEYTPRDFESWSKFHLGSERFDPTLWCVVRAGAEIAAGTICTGDTYGGGWVHALSEVWCGHPRVAACPGCPGDLLPFLGDGADRSRCGLRQGCLLPSWLRQPVRAEEGRRGPRPSRGPQSSPPNFLHSATSGRP